MFPQFIATSVAKFITQVLPSLILDEWLWF